MGDEMILSVVSRYTDDNFIPTYGYPISCCAGAFEAGKEYRAVLYFRFYKCGDKIEKTFSITIYNGSEDGYGDPDGRTYSDINEFNAEWQTVKVR